MDNSITKIIKNQIELKDYNYTNLKQGIIKLSNEINKQLKEEKLKKEERTKLLEMRFDLKRIRNILNSENSELL